MNKIKPKNNAKLFGSSDGKADDKNKSNESIGQSIERRAGLSKLRSKRVKFAIIFLIKTVETFAASIVPSFISVMIIFFNPNEKSWAVMKIVSFIITACVNWRLWLKYAAMKSGPKEFYLMNGLTYLLYFASSVIGYYVFGYLVYSMTYANLRVFEIFGMKTLQSILCSNGVMLLILVCCERFSNIKFKQFLEWIHKNGSEKVEMEDILTDDTPMQQNQVIKSLSIEEIMEHMAKEEQEAIEAKKRALEMMPDKVVDEEKMTKGRGEKVEHVDLADIDNDLTEGDFNAFAAAKQEYEENMQYSGDSLWGSHIYAGRTGDGKPVTEYEEEDMREVLGQMTENDAESEDTDDSSSLWDDGIYQGRNVNNGINTAASDENDTAQNNYDADTLWESGFYQGRNKESIPEKMIDFDDFAFEKTDANDDDSDDLWGPVSQGRGKKVQRLEIEDEEDAAVNANLSADYAPDDLWGSVSQGRGKKVQLLKDAEEEDSSVNSNMSADYDTDALWDKIYQGRKK